MIKENTALNSLIFKVRVFLLVAPPIMSAVFMAQQFLPANALNFLISMAVCIVAIMLMSTLWGMTVARFMIADYEHYYESRYDKKGQ